MVVNVSCAGCNARCSAKIKDVSELNATWYCPSCYDSHGTSYKSAEQMALEELKKLRIM